MESIEPKKPKRKIGKWILIAIGAFILIGVIAVATDDKKVDSSPATEKSTEPAAASTHQSTAIKVDALKYFKDYHDNEVNADEMYKGKEIVITGIVSSIQKDFTDVAYINLKIEEDGIQNVHIDLKNNSDAKTLHPGQTVTFSGTGGGMIMGDPMITDGVLK